jgi:DNA end-binding protein Ku
MVSQDSGIGVPIERGKTVKGYEFDKNRYLVLKDKGFESVKVESSSIMSVEKFVDAGSIDPIYYDASYYLAPDGQAGEDVYAVLREAIAKTGKTALTRVVISQRQRTVALRPMGVGLMAHTLYEDRDLNSAEEYSEDAAQLKTDPEMVELAT